MILPLWMSVSMVIAYGLYRLRCGIIAAPVAFLLGTLALCLWTSYSGYSDGGSIGGAIRAFMLFFFLFVTFGLLLVGLFIPAIGAGMVLYWVLDSYATQSPATAPVIPAPVVPAPVVHNPAVTHFLSQSYVHLIALLGCVAVGYLVIYLCRQRQFGTPLSIGVGIGIAAGLLIAIDTFSVLVVAVALILIGCVGCLMWAPKFFHQRQMRLRYEATRGTPACRMVEHTVWGSADAQVTPQKPSPKSSDWLAEGRRNLGLT
jgi:hypothetical protein